MKQQEQIVPKLLRITNFGILNSALVEFPKEGGLVYIRGVNKDTPYASSNGSGKSTLINAITWCLYECDTQGTRLTSAIRNGQESCCVELVVSIGGGQYCITRSRFVKALRGSVIQLAITGPGVDLQQEQAQRWIVARFGHAITFLASHVYAYEDGYQAYALTSDKAQKTLFDKLLGFDDLDEALARTDEQHAVLQKRVDRLRAGINKQKTILQVVKQLDAPQLYGADELRHKIAVVTGLISGLSTELTGAERALRAAERAHRRTEMAFHEANDALIDYVSTLRPLEAVIAAQRVKIDAVRKRTNCGVCGAPLRDKQWKDLLGTTWTEYRANVKQLSILILREGDLDDRKRAVSQLEKNMRSTKQQHEDCIRNAESIRSSMEREKYQLGEYTDSLNDIHKATAKHGIRLANAKSILAALTDALKERKVQLDTLSFWREGFGRNGIRAYRLDQITPQLNAIAAELSEYLFGDGTTVVYSTQSQLKTGEYRDRFSLTLQKEGEVLERHSAGQAARRDLIHLLTIASVARNLYQSPFMFLALDEAFRTIDAAGVHAAVELLRQLTPRFGTVIVVEHDEELASLFDRELVVVRKNGESNCG